MPNSENITIALRQIKLFAHHGAYPEERERGNDFEIDLEVELPRPVATITDSLDDTIDYVSLVECVHLVSSEKHYVVLEAFAYDLCKEVLDLHPEVVRVSVEVRKLHPPMPHRVESVGVKLTLP
jgi:dihydroneopterin aldolase